MKRLIKRALTICLTFWAINLSAQKINDNYMDNGVVSLAGKEGFSFKTQQGDFLFKPYMLVQATASYNYYDDEGLDKAYNQDNVANSGFAIPNAILGFTGKAFGRVTFNLSLNASQSGGALLQQAWFDIAMKEQLRVRVGKFKTPFTHAYLTTLGETLFPVLPTSLTSTVIIPHSLNAVNPCIATGFDLGVQVHGLLSGTWEYQLGIFNGTGINVNTATKTLSDDYHIPSLLYAGRLAYMPKGLMPHSQGNSDNLSDDKMLIALSSSYNVESEKESTNDYRAGIEFAWIKNRWYIGAEAYYMNMKFTERQQISKAYNFLGGYAQIGYFVTPKLQTAFRYDFYNRNGMDTDGYLNMPAVGLNYFFSNYNLKLQAMYQYTARTGHETQLDRDNDDLGLSTHSAVVMLQYSF
ncbi:porin [uncultured Bacteroides sp.]|uniref:porin n=1 Tax=uncultured Bacteroides sp. TaxID=162156 RepID=UPI002AAB711E|nr:porin [uncultured Bacteroides sp.]